MAWQDPVTDWTAADYLTADDMTRISRNLNYLAGDSVLPEDYTQNSFLTLTRWKAITARVAYLTAAAAKLETVLVDSMVTAENIQKIEQATTDVKIYFDLVQENRKYPLYTNQVSAGMAYSKGGSYGL